LRHDDCIRDDSPAVDFVCGRCPAVEFLCDEKRRAGVGRSARFLSSPAAVLRSNAANDTSSGRATPTDHRMQVLRAAPTAHSMIPAASLAATRNHRQAAQRRLRYQHVQQCVGDVRLLWGGGGGGEGGGWGGVGLSSHRHIATREGPASAFSTSSGGSRALSRRSAMSIPAELVFGHRPASAARCSRRVSALFRSTTRARSLTTGPYQLRRDLLPPSAHATRPPKTDTREPELRRSSS